MYACLWMKTLDCWTSYIYLLTNFDYESRCGYLYAVSHCAEKVTESCLGYVFVLNTA